MVSLPTSGDTFKFDVQSELPNGVRWQSQNPCLLVVGAGGVGTMAAFALENGEKASVTAVLRSNFDIVEREGFNITSLDHGEIKAWRPNQIRNTIPHSRDLVDPPHDFVVVATKDIADIPPSVSELIAPAITPGHTVIVLIQNGLNIEKPVVANFPDNPVLSGISYIGATEGPTGTVRHEDHDRLVIGAFPNPTLPNEKSSLAAKRFVDIYGACTNVDCVYEPDVLLWRWRKLLYNASSTV